MNATTTTRLKTVDNGNAIFHAIPCLAIDAGLTRGTREILAYNPATRELLYWGSPGSDDSAGLPTGSDTLRGWGYFDGPCTVFGDRLVVRTVDVQPYLDHISK
jgi:hypothetical protein